MAGSLTRRTLLVRTAQGAAGAAALRGATLLAGCDGGEDGTGDSDTDGSPIPDAPVDLPDEAVVVTKGPWVTLQGPTRARIRFETRVDVPLAVWVEGPDGGAWVETARATAEITYERPTANLGTTPDEPGAHTLHDVILEDLTPDTVVAWSAAIGGGETREGTFRVPPVGQGTVRLGWVADTMAPWQPALGNYTHLPGMGIDVMLHGGDITYNSIPSDTWNNFFEKMAPLLATAPFQPAIGNHDSDLPHELEDIFDRLFDQQGDNLGTRFHAFTAGVARVILMDSETYEVVADEQREFLEAELDKAEADPGIKAVIVGFHRPMITLSKYWKPENLTRFELFHSWIKGRVTAVFCGHAHGFEHFDFDGVRYIVDGCGGSPQYDVTVNVENAEALRPDIAGARMDAENGYGFTCIDVAEDGALTVRRYLAETGEEALTFEIPALA